MKLSLYDLKCLRCRLIIAMWKHEDIKHDALHPPKFASIICAELLLQQLALLHVAVEQEQLAAGREVVVASY